MNNKPYLLGCAVLMFLALGCNPNDTSYSNAERDSLEKLDKETEADNFKMLEEQDRLEAEQRAKQSGQAAPDAKPMELNPTPQVQEQVRKDDHPGPLQPPPEVKR